MRLFNRIPSLLKSSFPSSSTRRISFLKRRSVFPKYGAELHKKPILYTNLVRRNIHSTTYVNEPGIKDVIENVELREKIIGKEFLIEDLEDEDIPEVKEFIRSNFFHRNPLNSMLHLTYEDQKDMVDESIRSRIGNKVSIVARDRNTKKIVATCNPRILTKALDLSIRLPSTKNYNVKVQRLLHVLEILKTSVNFFEKYGVDKILELSMTTIDPAYQGKGLLNTLHLECILRGKDVGCQLVMGQLTNIILQKQAIKFGFTKEFELEFDSIMIDGEKVLDLEKNLGTNSFMVFSLLL